MSVEVVASLTYVGLLRKNVMWPKMPSAHVHLLSKMVSIGGTSPFGVVHFQFFRAAHIFDCLSGPYSWAREVGVGKMGYGQFENMGT
jgi:hypothetical protein